MPVEPESSQSKLAEPLREASRWIRSAAGYAGHAGLRDCDPPRHYVCPPRARLLPSTLVLRHSARRLRLSTAEVRAPHPQRIGTSSIHPTTPVPRYDRNRAGCCSHCSTQSSELLKMPTADVTRHRPPSFTNGLEIAHPSPYLRLSATKCSICPSPMETSSDARKSKETGTVESHQGNTVSSGSHSRITTVVTAPHGSPASPL